MTNPTKWSQIIKTDELEEIYEHVCNKGDGMVLPYWDEMLKAFELTPFDKVKVVILGQDPYHGFYSVNNDPPIDRSRRTLPQANGLAFSVDRGCKLPPSLKNIFKELKNDLGLPVPSHGDLTKWAEQGVLLLNSVLTVEHGKPGSHAGLGWEEITGRVIKALTRRKDPVIFLLWGKKAHETFASNVDEEVPLYFMRAAHPSPYSAMSGFFGCSHFSKVNEWLSKMGKEPIDWRLE